VERIIEERGVLRMEREKKREREREKERERGKKVKRDWFQTGQLSREKQKERDTKESLTTITTATKAWATRSGLSLFGVVQRRNKGRMGWCLCKWVSRRSITRGLSRRQILRTNMNTTDCGRC
jgi:hypothetical protein